jgi:hypothetical protein
MSLSQTIKVVSPPKKELHAPCAKCAGITAHAPLAQVDCSDRDPEWDIRWWGEYFIIICCGCKTVSFCEESSNSEDMTYNRFGEPEPEIKQKVFPGRIAGRQMLEDYYRLPHGLARIYEQTHEAIGYKQTILTGIGLRAIVEAVCTEKSAVGKDLSLQINDLVAKGHITKDGANILHSIRHMGNASAHEIKAHTEEELVTALEVVEHLLQGVYLIPLKAAKIEKKPKVAAAPSDLF